jgi:hypothetical protein
MNIAWIAGSRKCVRTSWFIYPKELLSRGLQGVEDLQIPLAMKAYVQDAGPVDYSKEWLSMFYRDPIEQLLDDTPFVIRSDLAKKMFDNAQIRRGKKALQIELTDIKKEDADRTPTFDEKLKEEYTGYMKGVLQLGFKPVRKLLKGEDVTFEDMTGSITLGMHLTYWEGLGGKPEGIKGLIGFYRSEYLKSVPSIEIRCKLWTGLAVYLKSAKPKESDANDVGILASVMPYADYLVFDKTMVDLTRDRLHLAEKYNTKIYALSDIDTLLTELEGIGKRESPLLSMCRH